jgi:hypothetical protein
VRWPTAGDARLVLTPDGIAARAGDPYFWPEKRSRRLAANLSAEGVSSLVARAIALTIIFEPRCFTSIRGAVFHGFSVSLSRDDPQLRAETDKMGSLDVRGWRQP